MEYESSFSTVCRPRFNYTSRLVSWLLSSACIFNLSIFMKCEAQSWTRLRPGAIVIMLEARQHKRGKRYYLLLLFAKAEWNSRQNKLMLLPRMKSKGSNSTPTPANRKSIGASARYHPTYQRNSSQSSNSLPLYLKQWLKSDWHVLPELEWQLSSSSPAAFHLAPSAPMPPPGWLTLNKNYCLVRVVQRTCLGLAARELLEDGFKFRIPSLDRDQLPMTHGAMMEGGPQICTPGFLVLPFYVGDVEPVIRSGSCRWSCRVALLLARFGSLNALISS